MVELLQGEAAALRHSNEPVTSLRAIDKRLSIINAQMDHLRTAATRAQRNRDIRRIRAAVLQVEGIRGVETNIVWEPAWHSGMIAKDAW